jgi:light-independent protochlorophyllide reductase subunit B
MKLALWTYEGPTHVGAMRIAVAMRDVHYVLHAPQGDTYADLLFTMIERRPTRPPVTYTTFQARDLGGDTAQLFKTAVADAMARYNPSLMLVGASCTAELIQDDPAGLAAALGLPVPVVPLELPSYQRKENWGAAETFYRIVRTMCPPPPRTADAAMGTTNTVTSTSPVDAPVTTTPTRRARCNLLGAAALGFRHRDDVRELRALLDAIGVDIHVVAPWEATPGDIARIPQADFNVVMYPEVAGIAAAWLEREHRMPRTKVVPIGVGATRAFVDEVCALAGITLDANAKARIEGQGRSTWYARSVDSTYLTGKRVFVFGDATHAVAAARVAAREFGFEVVGLGTYSREFARELREAAAEFGVEPLITDDYLEVEAQVQALQPELMLGTQMERHIAKRLGIPCAVISAPMHVQDFPARHSPQMGFEGANVLFDTWVHPLMMGLEEHLLHMFREDFEFHGDAAASHLPSSAPAITTPATTNATTSPTTNPTTNATPEEAANDALAALTAAPTHAANDASVKGLAIATSVATPLASSLAEPLPTAVDTREPVVASLTQPSWGDEAQRELSKIPFFVRGKARRNTERYAAERGLALITLETLYDAKAHFAS